jgi:hypothetical protein
MKLIVRHREAKKLYELEILEETTAKDVINALVDARLIWPPPSKDYQWVLLDSRHAQIHPEERLSSRLAKYGENGLLLVGNFGMEVKSNKAKKLFEYLRSIFIGIATGLSVGFAWWGFIWVYLLAPLPLHPPGIIFPQLFIIIALFLCATIFYVAYKFLKNPISGIIYGVAAFLASELLPIVLIGMPVTFIFQFYLEFIPQLWGVLPNTTIAIVLSTVMKAFLFPFLGLGGGAQAQKLLMLERLKASGIISQEAYKRAREELEIKWYEDKHADESQEPNESK